MKMMAKILIALSLFMVQSFAAKAGFPTPTNPATGIWIQQKGDIVPHPSTKATLYYTKYEQSDRVKSLDYYYDGAGYLNLTNKQILCTSGDGIKGADGIVHHQDGDLLVAAQGKNIHKVSKTAKADKNNPAGACLVKTLSNFGPVTTENRDKTLSGFWHLMMDPDHETLWAAGIPGYLYRISAAMDVKNQSLANKGYQVVLIPEDKRRSTKMKEQLATLIWDGKGHTFFTYSDYLGGGCESSENGTTCSKDSRKNARAGAFFGMITDTVKTYIGSAADADKYGGKVGDSVITAFNTKVLIDSLEGAHGGTYDSYSGTIFVFGGARIVQIEPYLEKNVMKARVVDSLDLREYFFNEAKTCEEDPEFGFQCLTEPRTPSVGWRLDQGTTDNKGHLFVASNTGHMVFVDYAANPQKHIGDNVLVHLQWIDNYLDDLAPLSGPGHDRTEASTGTDTEVSSSSVHRMSSALVQWDESSSSQAPKSSSSIKSSSSQPSSSGSKTSSSSVKPSSSGSNPNSSGSNPNSSEGSDPNSSGSNPNSSEGSNPNSSGSNPNSSEGSDPNSSGSNPNSSEGSDPNSSGSNPNSSGEGSDPNSSGSNPNSSGEGSNPNSSDGNGEGLEYPDQSSSSNRYAGFDDWDDDDNSGFDSYPTPEDYDRGDSIVKDVAVLIPVDSAKGTPGTVAIGDNVYLIHKNPVSADPMTFIKDAGLDSARVGDVVAITLDSSMVSKYFKDADSLTVSTVYDELTLIDPEHKKAGDTLVVNPDGSITIWVTATEKVKDGSIKITDGKGNKVVIDNINFYDPIPEPHRGYIKDSDSDKLLDYVEITLMTEVPKDLLVESVSLILDGKEVSTVSATLDPTGKVIMVDASNLQIPTGEFPAGAEAIVTYRSDRNGEVYTRRVPVQEMGSDIIKAAYAIRNVNGMDSLFVEFNLPRELYPEDIRDPNAIIMLNKLGFDLDQVSHVYMPTREMLIFVGKDLKLKGDLKDSVSLHPGFEPEDIYITSDEYDRQVVVTVKDRLPVVLDVEYVDLDGDGTLDQIVSNFKAPLTSEDVAMLHMSFPWYSYNGKMIELQASPADLKFDPKDSTRIIWDVQAASPIISGVTDVGSLPPATVFTYYEILGEVFVTEDPAPLTDKMSPIVSSAILSYGKKMDTLVIHFSEVIKYKDMEDGCKDCFSYIHGKDTIDLLPSRIDWAPDGRSAALVLDGSITTILPGDSLMIVVGAKDNVHDNFGNVAGEHPQPVVIAGLLNHLVESTTMGTFDADDHSIIHKDTTGSYTLQTISSVNLKYLPGNTTKEDMEKEGALGQLVQLGERFVPQLLDRAQISADGTVDPSVLDSLDPEKVSISFAVSYFDHIGQYVNDTTIVVPCTSPKFGGNCLATDKKVFVNWNFKDHRGRFVGTGVYMVQFKMVVQYEKKKIEEELKDKWGVRRKKGKRRK